MTPIILLRSSSASASSFACSFCCSVRCIICRSVRSKCFGLQTQSALSPTFFFKFATSAVWTSFAIAFASLALFSISSSLSISSLCCSELEAAFSSACDSMCCRFVVSKVCRSKLDSAFWCASAITSRNLAISKEYVLEMEVVSSLAFETALSSCVIASLCLSESKAAV